MIPSNEMTRDEFLYAYGWRPQDHLPIMKALEGYDADLAILNDYMAGVVFERAGRYEAPTLDDKILAMRRVQQSHGEFDLTTTYKGLDDNGGAPTPVPPSPPGTGPVNGHRTRQRADVQAILDNAKQAQR